MRSQGLDLRYLETPCAPALAFHFADGTTAASLVEFEARLRAAPLDLVTYHRDHFAPWLRAVIGDEPLAWRVEGYAQSAPAPESFREIVADLVGARLRGTGTNQG